MDESIQGMLRVSYFYDKNEIAYLSVLCPACRFEHSIRIDLVGHNRYGGNFWAFNGDYEKPTFNPSILANRGHIEKYHPVCHSFLHNGVWKFGADCTHELAGHNVPIIAPEPYATFQKRHGWHLFPWTDDEGNPK